MFKNVSVEALGISGTESELIELVLSHGIRGIELNIVEFAARANANGLDRARRLIVSAKLRCGFFRLPVDLGADEQEFREQIAPLDEWGTLAAEMKCTRALAGIEPSSDTQPYHANFELHRKRVNELAKSLEKSGIQLGLSTMAPANLRQDGAYEFIHNLDALMVFIGTVGASNVGAVIDPWHLYVNGTKIEDLKRLSREKIVAVELADAPRDVPPESCTLDQRLLPGETGVIDSAAFLVWLAEQGYDGPVTPTPAPSALTGKTRDNIVKLVTQGLDEVWKAAGLTPSGKLAVQPAKP